MEWLLSKFRYGRWCGAGPYKINPDPIDDVDNACRKHDLGYRQCGFGPLKSILSSMPGGANDCAYHYDTIFANELKGLLDSGKLEGKAKIAASLMYHYFHNKLKFDNPRKKSTENKGLLHGFKNWFTQEPDFSKMSF